MRVLKEGDKGKAICEVCGLTTTTYALRDVDFSDKRGTVKNIIVGVCDKCKKVASIPSQSVPQIKSEYNKTLKPLETRVPAHFIDILNLAIKKIDNDLDENFAKILFLYYLHNFSTGKFSDKNISNLLDTEIAKAKSSKRFSIKINKRTEREIEIFIAHSGLKNKTDLVKIIILTINNDIVQSPLPKHLSELKKLAAIYQ